MINLKLKTIANFIDKDDVVIDVGCDHGYLAIYLKENNLCQEVCASDISKDALDVAINNIKARNLRIKTYLTDGITNIYDKSINTAVIAGMGTNNILNIVKNAPSHIKKYVISSNNNYYTLRKEMYNMGFFVQKEVVVLENEKFYPVMVFTREYTQENEYTLMYGKSNNTKYLSYLIKKEEEILASIPKSQILLRLKHNQQINYLKKVLDKETRII